MAGIRFLAGFALGVLAVTPAGTAPAADQAPPTRPLNLTVTAKTATSVTLNWSAATDETGVTGYDVLRDGTPAGSAPSNAVVCTKLTPNRSYTFRVQARDAAGNLSETSNAVLTTPVAGENQVEPVLLRTRFNALVLNYDPHIIIDGSAVRAADHYGYQDVDSLIEQYVELMRKASGGQVVWSVPRRFDLDEFPLPADHSRPVFTASNFVTLRAQGYDYWNNTNPRGPDYTGILRDARFGIVGKVNAGEVDAIWVFGAPGSGFYETAMAGPTAFYVNGGPIPDQSLTRNVVFYGFGKESHQGVGFMCENTCHMTEVIIRDHIAPTWPRGVSSRAFNTLNLDNPARALVATSVNDWTHFTQAEAASWDPVLVAPGGAQAGLSHFPPTALHNYNWSTWGFDFNNAGPFKVYDGTWTTSDRQYHVTTGNGVKVLAIDDMGLKDSLGDYHPPLAFSDADVELTVRVMNGSSSSHAGFLFRVSACRAGANQVQGYYVGLNAAEDKVILAKLSNAFMSLTNATCALDANVFYRLRIEARGRRIGVFLDDHRAPLLSFEDASYLTGGFGMAAYSTAASFGGLRIVAHTPSEADKWYGYPGAEAAARDLSPLEWNGDQEMAMDGFYAWWWEHLPKNGGGHYATHIANGTSALLLNTWWPYVLDINRFTSTCPFPDVVFPPEDVAPPAAPASVQGAALGAARIGLSWDEATDNIGVTRYAVFRDGALLRKTALPYVTDTRLSPNTRYTYLVKACDGSGNMSTAGAQVDVATLPTDQHDRVIDGGFEVQPQVAGWSTQAFRPSAARFVWEPRGAGRHGTRCVSIAASQLNDACWGQAVTGLTPGATYWVSGWMKGTNIVREPGRDTGANLCLVGTWEHAPDGLDGTFDWRQVSFAFTAPPSGTVTLGCRLGYWSNTTRGKVWFDDILIVRGNELRLDRLRVLNSTGVEFELIASPGRSYGVEKSSDLQDWSELQRVDPVHPITEISDAVLPGLPRCFFRAVQAGTGRLAR